MTKRHYVMFAEAMRNVRPQPANGIVYVQWVRDVSAIANVFARASDKFERGRFMDAAGVEQPK